jgi:hypothetical protein
MKAKTKRVSGVASDAPVLQAGEGGATPTGTLRAKEQEDVAPPLPTPHNDLSWMLDASAPFPSDPVGAHDLISRRMLDDPLIVERRLLQSHRRAWNTSTLDKILSLPKVGSQLHLVTNGFVRYFDFIPRLISLSGHASASLYLCTWRINTSEILSLFDLIDRGILSAVAVLTSMHMKNLLIPEANLLVSGLLQRKQRVKSINSHAKVFLLQAGDDYLTVEGSANMTAYAGVEHSVLSNDRIVYEFHRMWIEDLLKDEQ